MFVHAPAGSGPGRGRRRPRLSHPARLGTRARSRAPDAQRRARCLARGWARRSSCWPPARPDRRGADPAGGGRARRRLPGRSRQLADPAAARRDRAGLEGAAARHRHRLGRRRVPGPARLPGGDERAPPPGGVLVVLPLALLLWLLARDRSKRIAQAHARLKLVERQRARLRAAVGRLGDAFAAKLELGALLGTLLHGSLDAARALCRTARADRSRRLDRSPCRRRRGVEGS